MFNPSNDCYMTSSSSSSNVIYNRSHSNARYHPYNRSYCSSNELETYTFDNNNNSLHHPHPTHLAAPVQTYETSTMPYDYNLPWPTPTSSSMETNEMTMDGTMGHTANLGGTGTPHCFKRRVSANKKERRRTQSINTAFSDLRTAIPNVQPDTKLSKIKTLKLATKYIEFLMDILAKDDSTAMPSAFKAEIIKTRKDHRDLMKFDHSLSPRKIKGRTGWPQAVWQSELNRNENFHQHPTGKTPAHASTSSVSNSPTLSHPSSSSSNKTTKHAMTR